MAQNTTKDVFWGQTGVGKSVGECHKEREILKIIKNNTKYLKSMGYMKIWCRRKQKTDKKIIFNVKHWRLGIYMVGGEGLEPPTFTV